jgi:exodeoxyribonuclease VII large subunit
MDDFTNRRFLTVSELTGLITDLLDEAFPAVWVQGEISGLATPSSGHVYFTLKDDTAQIRVVLFKNQARSLGFSGIPARSTVRPTDSLFSDIDRPPGEPSWRPADGQHVLVMGRVGVYAARGEYQLIADHIEPVGIGAMMLALEQLKKRLAEKGYFAAERKRTLPFLPARIAVVTSPTGAALFDILKVILTRMPKTRILIVPVRVQGEGAEYEIARGIEIVGRMRLADVVIVGRGGGSLEDLWAFNTEAVADAVFACEVPVISAVGHEIDFTVADLVADVRAPTPTAAAELVTPRLDDLYMTLDGIQQRMAAQIANRVARHRERLAALAARVRSPKQDIDRFALRFAMAASRLKSTAASRVYERKSALTSLSHALTRLSPEAVLSRGYSITERAVDGKIIRSVSDIDVGATARIRLHEGILLADIKGKKTDETS